MKLEPDLIKEILQYGEDYLPDRSRNCSTLNMVIDGYSNEQINHHVGLLWKNGYLECIDSSAGNHKDYLYISHSMNGHQYLNLLRSKAWNTAKTMIKDVGVIFVESAIKVVIDKFIPTTLT